MAQREQTPETEMLIVQSKTPSRENTASKYKLNEDIMDKDKYFTLNMNNQELFNAHAQNSFDTDKIVNIPTNPSQINLQPYKPPTKKYKSRKSSKKKSSVSALDEL